MASIISEVNYDAIWFDNIGHYAFPNSSTLKLSHLKEAAEVGAIHKETLAELAMANTSGFYIRTAAHADFDDQSDAKTAVNQRRNNDKKRGNWTDSIIFSKVAGKPGGLRLMGYHKENDEWYFLAVPKNDYEHLNGGLEVVIESFTNQYTEPKWGSTVDKKRPNKWLKYRLNDFNELAKYRF